MILCTSVALVTNGLSDSVKATQRARLEDPKEDDSFVTFLSAQFKRAREQRAFLCVCVRFIHLFGGAFMPSHKAWSFAEKVKITLDRKVISDTSEDVQSQSPLCMSRSLMLTVILLLHKGFKPDQQQNNIFIFIDVLIKNNTVLMD